MLEVVVADVLDGAVRKHAHAHRHVPCTLSPPLEPRYPRQKHLPLEKRLPCMRVVGRIPRGAREKAQGRHTVSVYRNTGVHSHMNTRPTPSARVWLWLWLSSLVPRIASIKTAAEGCERAELQSW
eukprot:1340878-Rhodomonas_salina.1